MENETPTEESTEILEKPMPVERKNRGLKRK